MKYLPRNTLNDAETYFASRGRFPTSLAKDGPARVLRARYLRPNYRKAEALALSEDSDSLQLLKSLLSRGQISEASLILERLEAVTDFDLEMKSEILLQRVRLHFYGGEWDSVVAICHRLEAHDELPALTRMCLHQLRSNAAFELGDFSMSLRDLDRLKSLETLFPHGLLPWYGDANDLRIELRAGKRETAVFKQDELLSKWKKALASSNLDLLLTVLRSRIDTERELGRPYADLAYLSWHVARNLGDSLYEALAFLDYFIAHGTTLVGTSEERRLRAYLEAFPRVRRFFEEAYSMNADHLSETGRSMRKFIQSVKSRNVAIHSDYRFETNAVMHVTFSSQNLAFDLKDGKGELLDLHERSQKLLEVLSTGANIRADVFEKVWGLTYVAERHDSLLRVALHRMKSQSGIAIESKDGMIRLPIAHAVISR